MINSLLRIWHPESYHGSGKIGNFFEGWYFKIAGKNGNNPIAIIPGISISEDSTKSHSFIQILIGESNKSYYLRFDTDDFQTKNLKFDVRIHRNFFRNDRLDLEIKRTEIELEGTLYFKKSVPWTTNFFEPGIMGWYSFMPFMECNHGVISMHNNIIGSLKLGNESIDYTDGYGYIEKDWGKSFPSAYVWAQCNDFPTIIASEFDRLENVSIMASVAKVPWLGGWFRGFICGILINGKLLRFATYTGAKLNYLNYEGHQIEIEFEDDKYRLSILSSRSEASLLCAPYNGMMVNRVAESINSTMKISLWKKKSGTNEVLIFEGKGMNAGLEYNGDLAEISELRHLKKIIEY